MAALKDPLGANLDRIQIVKGWVDARWQDVQEKVYDVVWADAERRKPGADGKLPPVGNTVDVPNANWTNTIGDPELITSGAIRTSTRRSAPSTTRGSWRSRRRAGPPTTPSTSTSRRRPRCR